MTRVTLDVDKEGAAMLDLLRDRYSDADQRVLERGLDRMVEEAGIDWEDARRVATLRRVDIDEPDGPRSVAVKGVLLAWESQSLGPLDAELLAGLAVDALLPGLMP